MTTTINTTTTTTAILRTICALGAIIALRSIIASVKATKRALRWMNTKHDFFTHEGEEEVEPITATGWQLMGMTLATMVVCTLLSIEW